MLAALTRLVDPPAAAHRRRVWLAAVAGCFAVGIGVFDRLGSDVGVVPGSESERGYALMARRAANR